MRRRCFLTVLAMVAALCFALVGCGSDASSSSSSSQEDRESVLTLTLPDGTVETYTGDEIPRFQLSDSEKYSGSRIELIAPIKKIYDDDHYANHKVAGYLQFDKQIFVQVPSKYWKRTDFPMKEGDYIKATGYIFWIDSKGVAVLDNTNTDSHIQFRTESGVDLLDTTITLEKVS